MGEREMGGVWSDVGGTQDLPTQRLTVFCTADTGQEQAVSGKSFGWTKDQGKRAEIGRRKPCPKRVGWDTLGFFVAAQGDMSRDQLGLNGINKPAHCLDWCRKRRRHKKAKEARRNN